MIKFHEFNDPERYIEYIKDLHDKYVRNEVPGEDLLKAIRSMDHDCISASGGIYYELYGKYIKEYAEDIILWLSSIMVRSEIMNLDALYRKTFPVFVLYTEYFLRLFNEECKDKVSFYIGSVKGIEGDIITDGIRCMKIPELFRFNPNIAKRGFLDSIFLDNIYFSFKYEVVVMTDTLLCITLDDSLVKLDEKYLRRLVLFS